MRLGGRSLALGGAALVALVAVLRPVTVLELDNPERGRAFRTTLRRGEVFSVVYHHSMYDQPVTEDFVAEDGRIVLQAVSSPSAAVREYFGLDGPGERHEVIRAMTEVVFRVATGAPQRLRIHGVERSFLELGEHGDRLVMRASRRPAAVVRWLAARGAGAVP